ncbi:MAG: tyrosine--tRNA ligase [Patescibacteria group bacterium]
MLTIDNVLTRAVDNILPSKEGLAELMAKKKITLYQGFDPSMPSLHLGNFVGLMKLREFQKLGHRVIFLVGDFTGMIGDPTDKKATRKKLTREQVLENAKGWKNQASMLLDFDGPNAAQIKFNSEWNDKLTFKDLLEITSNFTVQQMLERDMFQDRLDNKAPIYLHEFLYPVAQAIDSVKMDVDLEIGGSDQLFNMMAGRTLMKAVSGREKYVLSMKLLVDKDGNKVGKTTGNALFMDSTPENFYAGIMSFPDEVLPIAFELLTEVDLTNLNEKIQKDPLKEKKRLGLEIINTLWGGKRAKEAQLAFETTFQKREFSGEAQSIKGLATLAETLASLPSVGSMSQAKRLLAQGAVDVSGETVKDGSYRPRSGEEIKIGKKTFIRIR